MDTKLYVIYESQGIDEAIEKANQLVELLREVKQIIDSLFGEVNTQE